MPVSPGRSDCWNAASMNTAVSRPSRSTARNAITIRPIAEPSTSATEARACRSPLRSAECRRIQTIIQVIIPTAASAMTVSSCSCSRCGQVLLGDVEPVRHAAAQDDRAGDAEPHPAQRVAAALLAEERGDDPDDQRRLEALPQTDDEGGKHGRKVRNPLAVVQVNLP